MEEKVKLIATDMDGTFLDDKGQYDKARFEKVLTELDKKGILFVAASGRGISSLESLFRDYKDEMGLIAENGGYVKVQGDLIYEYKMSKTQYQKIVSLLESMGDVGRESILLSGVKSAYIHESASDRHLEHMKHYYAKVQKVADLFAIDDAIYKVTMDIHPDKIDKASQTINRLLPDVKAVTTGFTSIDIISSQINKAVGLQKLATNRGFSQNQMLAFGDNLNDYQMLQFVGKAIAPANARPQIKELADEVIPSHAQESVLTYIEKMIER